MGRILVTVIVMIRVRIMFNVSTGIMTQARIIWGGWSRALLYLVLELCFALALGIGLVLIFK